MQQRDQGQQGQQLLNNIDALLSEGSVDHRGDLGGALLLLHANLLVVALLGGALLLSGALLFSGALLLGCALLLGHLSALLLLGGVYDVAALLLGVGGALLPVMWRVLRIYLP